MILVNPQDLILGCRFADVEHVVIANALNAIGKLLIQKQDKETVFNDILPLSMDYLSKHLLHEEKVLENAFEYWVEEKGLVDLYEDLKRRFWEFLKVKGKDFDNYEFKDFIEFIDSLEQGYSQLEEIIKWWKLIENQKHGHRDIAQKLEEELKKINPQSPPKTIASQLGMIISYILTRVMKLDKKYVDFYKKNGIPACDDKPLIPDSEVLNLLKEILQEDFIDPLRVVKTT